MNEPYEFDESSANEPLLSEDAQKVFEDQLRSVLPTPPARDWSELQCRLLRDVEQPVTCATDRDKQLRPWRGMPVRTWRSHLVAGLVGMLSGAAAMFLLLNTFGWRMDAGIDGSGIAHVDASQERHIAPNGAKGTANNTVDGEADSMAVRDPAEESRIASDESPTRPQRDLRQQLQRDRLDAIVHSILDQDAALPPLTVGYGIVSLESGTRSGLEPREPTLEINVPRIPRSESDRETSRSASELLEEYLEDFNAGNRFSTTM